MLQSSTFYKWAWDIVTGCRNGCPYCYARAKWEREGKDFEEVQFHEDLLEEPFYVKPSIVFCNHYSDIMGAEVKNEWIEKIIGVCEKLPEHVFLFLSKVPARYKDFTWPDNCILGVTMEMPEVWWRAEAVKGLRCWASIEPIQGDFSGKDFSQFEFVIIGSMLGKNSREYYDTVHHNNIAYTR